MLRNTKKNFGSITKFLHWLIFILIASQFYFIWFKNTSPSLYMMLHKSIGISLLLISFLFILWNVFNTQPLPLTFQPRWQYITAKIVQHSLLTLLLLIPIVGYLLSCTNGKLINFFGLLTLPCLISQNKHLSAIFFVSHQILAYTILALVCIHSIAALYHHFIAKDNVLKKMLPFTTDK